MLVNLTPHTLNIHSDNSVVSLPPSGQVARVQVEYVKRGDTVDDITVYEAVYGEVEGLPEPEAGTAYVVSGMVAAAMPRHDVFAPGDLVRDESGRPVGCRGLKAS